MNLFTIEQMAFSLENILNINYYYPLFDCLI